MRRSICRNILRTFPHLHAGAGIITAGLFAAVHTVAAQTPLSADFTYQGILKQSGVPFTGVADIAVARMTAPTGGSLLASMGFTNVNVDQGLFTIPLNLNLQSSNFWFETYLEISVRAPAGSGTFTTLSPRQRLTSTPIATYAQQTRGLAVDAVGNVGIGTAAPGAMLSLGSSNGNTKLALWDDGTPLLMGMGIGPNQFRLHLGQPSNRFSFLNAPNGIELLTILGNGLVGISTPFPSNALTVNGNADVVGYLGVGTPSPASALDVRSTFLPQIRFGLPGSATGQLLAGTNGIVLADNAGNYRLWINQSNGFVGINTTAPAHELSVNGNASKPGGGSWAVFSDVRLKKNMADIHGALEQLLALRGVTFEYINPKACNELEGTRIGMIAQEVEQVFPDWVQQCADGYKSVTYRGFEALTVEALRELREEKDAQIEALRAEKDAAIAALQSSNERLQNRLTALEAAVARLADVRPVTERRGSP